MELNNIIICLENEQFKTYTSAVAKVRLEEEGYYTVAVVGFDEVSNIDDRNGIGELVADMVNFELYLDSEEKKCARNYPKDLSEVEEREDGWEYLVVIFEVSEIVKYI